ncbi:MAG: type II toxin-antitoxin system RelE/ParE family toxin [Chthoniobacterales bacterium]|nr:type II toxin-antitoxin system RelE/ParE family toxin [Chthoniobacterales bacterium]
MARIIWTEPALQDLDAIADYISLDKPLAARQFVQRVFDRIEQLATHPKSGSVPAELRGTPYRQLVIPPVRIFYRTQNGVVYIVYAMRDEKLFRNDDLLERDTD